jgi:hypothetical protein
MRLEGGARNGPRLLGVGGMAGRDRQPVFPIQSIENGKQQGNNGEIDTDPQQICSGVSRSITPQPETVGRA